MDGGAGSVNNPYRVPPLLTAIDGPQAGAPRVIHPIGAVRVGTPMLEVVSMDTGNDYVIVDETQTVLSKDGKDSFEFVAGSRVHRSVAERFGLVDEPFVAILARPVDEVPDLAPTTLEERALPAAPENRMEPAPANRTRRSTAPAAPDADAQGAGS